MQGTAVATAPAVVKGSKLITAARIVVAILLWALLMVAISVAGSLMGVFAHLLDGLGVELSFPAKVAIAMHDFWRGFGYFLSPWILLFFVLGAFRNSFSLYLRATLTAVVPWSFLVLLIPVLADSSKMLLLLSRRDSMPLDQSTLRLVDLLSLWQAHAGLCSLGLLVVFLALAWGRAEYIRRFMRATA